MRTWKFLVTHHGEIHGLESRMLQHLGPNLEAYASKDRTVWTQLPGRVAVSIEVLLVEHVRRPTRCSFYTMEIRELWFLDCVGSAINVDAVFAF